MTQHLETLKGILQSSLNDQNVDDCFHYQEALYDAVYACQFGTSIALEQWINIWLTGPHSYDYTKGVQFVAEQWDRVVSEDKGEENV